MLKITFLYFLLLLLFYCNIVSFFFAFSFCSVLGFQFLLVFILFFILTGEIIDKPFVLCLISVWCIIEGNNKKEWVYWKNIKELFSVVLANVVVVDLWIWRLGYWLSNKLFLSVHKTKNKKYNQKTELISCFIVIMVI